MCGAPPHVHLEVMTGWHVQVHADWTVPGETHAHWRAMGASPAHV